MNAHDSERIKGMLESIGLGEAPSQADADVLVFNTCTIREKPDTRFAAHMGNAAKLKRERPGTVVAVGGCYAEAQRERLFELYPDVDVAFGPGTISHLGDWLGAGGEGVARGAFGTGEERAFAARLPVRRERRFQAWVQVSMGCNSVCSYCIVPAVRGRETSRRPGEVLAEVERLTAEGVREVTLLGQNVNSYGRDVGSSFAELLRAVDVVRGIERIRFTSPHPKDFRRDVIAAMAECAAVCEHAHLPLQSGSSRILKAMRRTYNRERYLDRVALIREHVPDVALAMATETRSPGAASPLKLTVVFLRVRPRRSSGSVRLEPSTSTSSTMPTRPAFRSAATRCTTSTSRSMRSRFSSSGTCSGIAAASVPARGE